MPYLFEQLVADFRSDVADRADVDQDGNERDTLWSAADVLRYINTAVARLASDTLAIRKNFEVALIGNRATYTAPYELLDIVRARLTYGPGAETGRSLTVFDLDEGFIEDDYGQLYYTTRDIETKTGIPRGITRDFDPMTIRVFPIPVEVGTVYINASIVPPEIQEGVPIPFQSFKDRELLLMYMKKLAYAKQDADVLDLRRSQAFADEYDEKVIERAAEIDRDRRPGGGIVRSYW
jgi:hypothetical protein